MHTNDKASIREEREGEKGKNKRGLWRRQQSERMVSTGDKGGTSIKKRMDGMIQTIKETR